MSISSIPAESSYYHQSTFLQLNTITVEFKSIHHEGYLTCQNMVVVTGHEGVLMKGLNCDNQPNMGFVPVNG